MSERYIPFGAYEAKEQAWGLLQLARYQVRPGNVDEALKYLHGGLALLPGEFFPGEKEAAKAEIISICLSCAADMAPTARGDAIALVEGTLRIVGEHPELRAALAELRGDRRLRKPRRGRRRRWR